MLHQGRLALVCYFVIPVLVVGWDVHISPTNTTRKAKDSFALTCSVQNLENEETVDSIEWLINGEKIDTPRDSITPRLVAPNRKQLLFVEAALARSGDYACRVLVAGDSQEIHENLKIIQPPVFANPKMEQHPLEGTSAPIECHVSADPPAEITWHRNNAASPALTEGGERGYALLNDSQVLVIPDFRAERDDGIYVCMAEQLDYFELLHINVTGYAIPSIAIFDYESRGFEGKNKMLTCQATGKPTPSYKWYKDSVETGALLETSDKYRVEDGILEIDSLSESDAGDYVCLAENEVGSNQRSATITVYLKPRVETIAVMDVAEGEAIDLPCRYHGDGDLRAHWLVGDVELKTETSDIGLPVTVDDVDEEQNGPVKAEESVEQTVEDRRKRRQLATDRHEVRAADGVLTLHISNVQVDDAGVYKCVVGNEAGNQTRESRVRITHAPELQFNSPSDMRSFSGRSVSLICVFNAVPRATFTWQHLGSRIEADGRKIVIENDEHQTKLTVKTVDSDDYGTYACTADNGIGSPVTVEMRITQVFPPSTPRGLRCHDSAYPNYGICEMDDIDDDIAHLPTELIFQYAMRGETIVNGFEWDRDAENITLQYGNGKNLRLPDLKTNEAYRVRVRAVNIAGESEFSEIVDLNTTVPWVPEKPSSVSVDCTKLCTVTWESPNDHGSSITGYTLIFHRVEAIPDEMDEDDDDGVPTHFLGNEKQIDVDGSVNTLEVPDLRALSKYQLQLRAMNAIGTSDPYTVTFFTSEWSAGNGLIALSIGQLLAIVAGILLFLLIVIDIICFAVNRWGLLACFCTNCLGRNVHDEKMKDVERGCPENKQLLKESEGGKPGLAVTYSNGGSSSQIVPSSTTV